MDSKKLEGNDVELNTSKIATSNKRKQAVDDSKTVIQSVQDSERSQYTASSLIPSIQVLSIDVECVATGYSHLDRAPCSVAIVNDRCDILFDSLIKPDKPVVSDLFPFSGVRKADLRCAPSFDEVIKKVIDISLILAFFWRKSSISNETDEFSYVARELKTGNI